MKFASAVSLVLCAFAVAGCPDEIATNQPKPNCMIDANCDDGQVCADGFCTEGSVGCAGNVDCDAGLVCRSNGAGRSCVPPVEGGECGSDADCATTDLCTATLPGDEADCLVSLECANAEPDAGCDEACYGHCISRPSCVDDGDCEVTERCDGEVCLPIGDCDADSDCPTTAACIAGVCTDNGDCTADDDCDGSQSCVDGDCVRNDDCSADVDCPADQRCVEGVCLRRPACLADDECAFDERCDLSNDGGTCVVIGGCLDVDDCGAAPGVACLDGVCTRAPCGRDSECDDGQFCNGAETCNPRVGCASGTAPTTVGLPACANESCDEVNDRLVLTAVNSRCADASPCTDDVCDVALGCANPENTFVPAAGPAGDCVRTVCQAGAVTVVPDNGEVPTVQGPLTDCRTSVCLGGISVLVNDDTETPAQGATTDCRREVCQGGGSVQVNNDLEVPPQGPATDCKREVCQGGLSTQVNNDVEVPLQGPVTDCKREICQGGVSAQVNNDVEVPPQGPTTDCRREVCQGGVSAQVNNDVEVPPQGPATDCKREVCQSGASAQVANDVEVPPQGPTTDCKREVCQSGASAQIADNTQLPADVGCKDGTCVNGTPGTVTVDGNCTDTAVCTVGTCNVDGSCAQAADDDLCNCAGTQVGLCLPGDGRAPTSGNLAGCVCLQPAVLTCGLDDADSIKRVLERFDLFATAPGAAAGSTFVWDLAGTPVGADPAAQFLGNATSGTDAFFQATSPSATGIKDYELRVTLQEPELPAQTCIVRVEAQPIPDTLEVTLFMNDGVDVDVHVIGGAGSSRFDMPFHELHDATLGDVEDRDCYWDNCPVCSVSIPGQSCIAVSPRQVDFDGDGAALTDKQDPQLDIDNTRGCFTGDNGEQSCVPEKITVEQPVAGTYIIWPYLWGPPNSDLGGLLSSPAGVTVSLEVQCRGVRVTRTRTLRSDTTDGSGVAAPQKSARRYGGFAGFIEVTVPATGACTISN